MTDIKENKKDDNKKLATEVSETMDAVKPADAKGSGEAKKDTLPKKDISSERSEKDVSSKDTTKSQGDATKNKNSRQQFQRNNFKGGQNQRKGFGGGRGGSRSRRGGRFERAKPEFDQKIVNIRRVTRVMAGGRRFSFSVAVVAGNRNGKVGVGLGKAADTSLAIEKAFKNAKKNMVMIKRDKNSSIPHEVSARYCTSEVFIKPAKGKGIVAGSSARNVLDLAGITDVSSKILSRSKNKINIARATVLALKEFTE